jgi:hypothetical protein
MLAKYKKVKWVGFRVIPPDSLYSKKIIILTGRKNGLHCYAVDEQIISACH